MQSTIANDGNNGCDPNKIIGVEQELTTNRHMLKERSPNVTLEKVPAPVAPDVAGGAPVEPPPAPKKKKPIALILAGLGVGAIAADGSCRS